MPVTARPSRQLRRIPGMVANAVVIRLAMAPELSLMSLTQQVAIVMRQALRHQQFRLEDLRARTRTGGPSASRSPGCP